MNTNAFDNAVFNLGWELPVDILLFDKNFPIKASADAYYATEKATDEQHSSYEYFMENSVKILKKTEEILSVEAGSRENASERYTPKMITIRRNGDFGIVFDDKENYEDGFVVTVKPRFGIESIDVYF